ncbi:COBW domain-containing protein [Pseudoscourfieldia marina]
MAAAAAHMPDGKIPVTVVTGFLGSGKTTLVNYILQENHGLKIAVIENEFGEVGIDDELVSTSVETQEELFEMNNGCVCCTVRGDLVRILTKLTQRKKRLDAVLIETTGLADPGPVAQTFFADEDLKLKLRLDSILTVVDAKHVMLHLDEKKPEGVTNESLEQVAFADRILLNKVDLVSKDELSGVRHRLKRINATAQVFETERSRAPLDKLLGLSAFDLNRIVDLMPTFLDDATSDDHEHSHGHGHGHEHDAHCEDEHCGHEHGHGHEHDMDCKDEHCEHEHEHGHGHGHGHEHDPECKDEHCEHEHEHGHGNGHDHEPKHKHAKHHHHDDSVTSVGILADGSLDQMKLNKWLSNLLQEKGNDIYRSKGVLSLSHSTDKYVFQGVHHQMTFASSTELGKPGWAENEKRVNKMVFIGKHLNRQELEDSFKACIV